MKTWFASYYTSHQAEPLEATVLAVEDNVTIGFRREEGATHTVRWNMPELAATFEHNLQATKITIASEPGIKLIINGQQAFDFIQQMQAEYKKPWYKKDKTKDFSRNLLIFLGLSGILMIAYFLIFPWLSEKLASTVSIKTEEEFGSAVYDALSIASTENKEATVLLNDFFSEMKVQTDYNVKITVVNGDVVNAFALPGGNIVVYSALLNELKSYPELAALLSHEFIHVNNRHSTKSVFRQIGSKIFFALLFGKFGSVTSVLVDQADRFKSLKYTRSLEKEADMEGLNILKERKIDTEGFIKLFEHLKASAPSSALPELLGSHPDIDKRIGYIRDASVNNSVEENTALKTIFEKLK
jgi:Zn-dependent protease with chaperone function